MNAEVDYTAYRGLRAEELRLLTNFQLNDRFLLTVVLMGQPGLRHRVAGIPQLNQQIAVRAHLGRDSSDRCVYEGGSAVIYEQCKRIGLLINTLCDQCLFGGGIEKVLQVDSRLVQRVGQFI